MGTLILIMVGGSIGFFAASLCKAAGKADRDIEEIEKNMEKNMGK